jgi:hypothetical protein
VEGEEGEEGGPHPLRLILLPLMEVAAEVEVEVEASLHL